ncbi:MAG: S8 family serine peptidase, partial [Bacteroidota bacterium]
MNDQGIGTVADLAAGIVYAVDHGSRVINVSAGTYGYSRALEDSVRYANDKEVLVVASAGNDGINQPMYPAALPDVIAVSATDQTDAHWSGSNYGNFIDVAAPGVSVLGLDINQQYAAQTGTSAAAAQVSGAAGLLSSVITDSSQPRVGHRLWSNAVDVGPIGRDDFFGFGVLDIWRVLTGKAKILAQIEQTLDQNILTEEFHSLLDLEQIKTFLSSQQGSLKDYVEVYPSTQYTAAQIIHEIANDSLLEPINQRILLVLLELKAGVVTRHLPSVVFDSVFGVSSIEYENFYRNQGYTEEKIQEIMGRPFGFQQQLMYTAEKLRRYELINPSLRTEIILKDGSRISPSANINAETYALFRIMGDLAKTKSEFETWTSTRTDSFYDFYVRWFGMPVMIQSGSNIEPPTTQFLNLPYNKTDSCGIVSFFDHKYPIYEDEERQSYGGVGTYNVILFTGKELASAYSAGDPRLINGYSSYSGHNGLDVLVRNCSTRVGRSVIVPANGVISIVNNNAIHYSDLGNYVAIDHDINNDGHVDYRTRYGHMATSSIMTVGQNVTAGDIIGVAGTTGNSTGVHLHFDLKKIIYNSNWSINSLVTIDPNGWWGGYQDPWP